MTTERDVLAQLLAGDDEASAAALEAFHSGASYIVWGGTPRADSLARTYGRRLRLTQSTGTQTVGLERAVQLLGRHDRPVRLGQVKAADGTWVFLLFLTEDASALVACTSVRQREP
ncbi:hypothetical protein OG760_16065 [Streptomyces sp. NBC_00963]|uniref:hypothetical protein n=1 Tax=Streptomyces sp. NBC_00963 TaxID=2903697 RepID=UPI003866DD8F|nr:hypothetical protein OG760_16065 [Streptomyces sp. NBC_00963]